MKLSKPILDSGRQSPNRIVLCSLVLVFLILPHPALALPVPPHLQTWNLDKSIADLAVDSSNDLYVMTSGGIVKISSGGDIISTMGRSGNAIAVASNGDIYQIAGGHVVRYDSEGSFITEWSAFGSSAFSRPAGLAVDDDVVYVSDRNMSHITKYTTDGEFLMQWSTTLSVDPWDSYPEGLVVDAEGNILVADGIGLIKRFSPEGVFIDKWGDSSAEGDRLQPIDLALDDRDNVFTTMYGEELVTVSDSKGRRLGWFGTFTGDLSIAIDGEENIYIADGSTLQKLGGFSPASPPIHGPAVLLHLAPVGRGATACSDGPTTAGEIVTAGEIDTESEGRYFVYLLGSPTLYVDSERGGITGIQVGIDYREAGKSGNGIGVHGWTSCADLEFPQDEWPRPASGNTITWSLDACQETEVVNAGYFYVTAYAKSRMSVIAFPPTGKSKVASCLGVELEAALPLESSRLGWAAFGESSGGCNPLLEPCSDPVPAEHTTWGRIKAKYGN